MFCKNCGKEVDPNAVACPSCGCAPSKGNKFCPNCGAETKQEQIVCLKCGVALESMPKPTADGDGKNRVTASLLAIFLGAIGAHEFYLGHNRSALIRLAMGIIGLVIGLTFVASLIGLIEGIIYLTKSDEEFKQIYVLGGKEWF